MRKSKIEKHPPVKHPLVYRHPESEEIILFASPRFTIGIADIPEDEGKQSSTNCLPQSRKPMPSSNISGLRVMS